MEHKSIIQNIKNKSFEKVYFLHGEEPYFIDEITQAIIDNALEDHERDFNQSIVYGKEADINSIIADARQFPMMAQRRLVIIKEAQYLRNLENLTPYLENPSDQTVFVINYKYKKYDSRKKSIKAAKQNGIVFLSNKIPDYKLPDWISSLVKEKGFGITQKSCMLLAEYLGDDLGRVSTEIDKLAIILEKGTTINEVHIEENIGISKEYNAFELVDAIGTRNLEKAMKIVDYFDKNPKAGNMVMIVSNIFKFHLQMMKIHFLPDKSRQNIASALQVHPFVAGKILQSSQYYNPKKIAKNIAILEEYDLKSKGVGNSSFNQGELLKEMIFKLII